MSQRELRALVAAANARYTDPERNVVINGETGETPRFELYHFSLSLCSQKLRTVLDEKRATYLSHDINILPPGMENYYPEYVRVRLEGGRDLLGRMVAGYTGRSSTETEGFDPLVVPTLVDHDAGRVLVNSKRVCLYLDSEVATGTELVPKAVAAEVLRQVDIVDRTPHPARPGEPRNGGPQMVEVSRDGRRVYTTNSLYSSWDPQFYPDGISGWMAKLDVKDGGGIEFDTEFFLEFERDLRPHQIRLEGGDASSDSFCFS